MNSENGSAEVNNDSEGNGIILDRENEEKEEDEERTKRWRRKRIHWTRNCGKAGGSSSMEEDQDSAKSAEAAAQHLRGH